MQTEQLQNKEQLKHVADLGKEKKLSMEQMTREGEVEGERQKMM